MRKSHEAQIQAQRPVFWQLKIDYNRGCIIIDSHLNGKRPADDVYAHALLLGHRQGEIFLIARKSHYIKGITVPGTQIRWAFECDSLDRDRPSSETMEDTSLLDQISNTYYFVYQLAYTDHGGIENQYQQMEYQVFEIVRVDNYIFKDALPAEREKIEGFIEREGLLPPIN